MRRTTLVPNKAGRPESRPSLVYLDVQWRRMGKVVKLDAAAKERGKGSPAAKQHKTGRRRRSKTALVLGGGGFTGGVYEIGALRALDLLSVNRTVNQFDVYVGTSAGSFVAAMTANGVTPEEMMRVVNQQVPTPFRDVDVGTLLRPNLLEFAWRGLRLPLQAAGLLRQVAGQLGQISAMDIVLGLAEALPSGVYSTNGIERYVRQVLSDPDRADDFRLLESELYLVATDLDTCERIIFGAEDWDDVPISSAVAASTALPMVYKPVEIKGRELVDGGIVSTTNIDIAVEAGAKLLVVVNPLVPFVNEFDKRIPTLFGSRVRRVSDMGFPQIGYQTFKLLAYQRLHEIAKQWEQKYPGVDIVLIEPEPDDELMFQTSIMNFSSRVDIARHGFQSVTLKLAEDYEHFREICERHGIEISATRVRKVVKHFAAEKERTRAWRKILEQTTGALLRQSAGD
jgi:NTE family protein